MTDARNFALGASLASLPQGRQELKETWKDMRFLISVDNKMPVPVAARSEA